MVDATHIYLLRHGACEGGTIFRGTTDSALSAQGLRQMSTVLAQFDDARLDAVVSSPLARCRQPAQDYCRARDLPLQLVDDLREIHFGEWEGELVEHIESAHPERIGHFWRDPVNHPPPGGETMAEFQQRVLLVWRRLIEVQRGKRLLLVSHGGVIRLILAQLLGMPLRPLSHLHVPHGCLSHIAIYHSPGRADWPQLMFHNGRLTHE